MGKTSFRLAPDLTPDELHALNRITLCGGYDHAPVPTTITRTAGLITLTRDADESGTVAIPWPYAPGRESVVLTATLREQDEPYDLVLELARGRVNQIRNQVADWLQMGFRVLPADLWSLTDLAKRFGRTAVTGTNSATAAREVLTQANTLADRFASQFAAQLAEMRIHNHGPLDCKLGLRLSQMPSAIHRSTVTSSFTALRLVPRWHDIEPTESNYQWTQFDALVDWATMTGLAVSIGPVIDLADGAYPEWIRQWSGDLPSLAAFFCDFCEQLARRYGERVHHWQILAGFNHIDCFGLGEDDRLRLAARVQDCARATLPHAEFTLGLAQPWGDYLASEEYTYSPLLFADTLIRAGFHFAAVELEIFQAMSGQPARASAPRDALSIYRLCELFSVLSIPLELTFGHPLNREMVGPGCEESIALSMALQRVMAIYWEGWSEQDASRLPGSALACQESHAVAFKKFLKDLRVKNLA